MVKSGHRGGLTSDLPVVVCLSLSRRDMPHGSSRHWLLNRGGHSALERPLFLSRMLCMYCLKHWYGLADEALEDALSEFHAQCTGVPAPEEPVGEPDHYCEQHDACHSDQREGGEHAWNI